MAHSIRTRLTISLLLTLCFFLFVSEAVYAQQPELGKLTLSGRGEVKAAPDEAELTFAVVTQSKTAAEALAQNSKSMNEALAAVKAAGIDARNIQTSNLGVSPQYIHIQNAVPRISGYEARNTIIMTVKDLSKLGALLDKAVILGVNQVNGPVFNIQEKDTLQNQARLLAMEDVKQQAALYQKGLGLKLGRILQVNESADMPVPIYRDMASMEAKVAAAPTPVEAGELNIVSQVKVVWEILP